MSSSGVRSCLVVSTAVSSPATSGVTSVLCEVDADDRCSSSVKLGNAAKILLDAI